MAENSDFENERASLRKMTKKKVLKITSVIVVAILILSSLPQIMLLITAPNPPPPPLEPRGNSGHEDFYQYAGGMVNTANGNLYLTHKDISIKARGFNIEIIRAYNLQVRSTLYPEKPFGAGWTCNYFIRLEEHIDDNNVTLTEGDGSVHEYGNIDGTNYSTPAGKHGRLTKHSDDTGTFFILRFLDGSIYNFDCSGVLLNITDKNGNILKFTYTFGKLTKVEEDLGLSVVPNVYLNLSYNGNKIVNITDNTGRIITYDYNGDYLMNVTDTTGNTTRYSYTGVGDIEGNILISIIDKVNHRLNFSYEVDQSNNSHRVMRIYTSMWNSSSNSSYNSFKIYEFKYYELSGIYAYNDIFARTEIIDARDYTTKVYMNYYGNPLKIEDPTGNYTQMKWDVDFNVIERTDKNLDIWLYEYTKYSEGGGEYQNKTYGLPDTITDPNGYYIENEYIFNNTADEYVAFLKSVTNKRGYKTTYQHDSNYNLIEIEDAKGNKAYRTYDCSGNMVSYNDFRGFTSNYSYDAHGNMLNVTDPGGNVTKYGYDSLNRLKNITDARGYKTTYEYDALDRIVKITDALGNYTSYTYDEGSEGVYTTGIYGGCGGGYSVGGHTPISIKDANGHITNLTLNHSIKRIEKIEQSPGCGCTEKNFKYDKNGNLIEFKDANGNKTTYSYNNLNRLTSETDARGNSTTYTYDVNGNLLTKTNRRGYTTTYKYDNLNRKINETDALGNSTTYTYDEGGNLKTVKNARGYTTTYYYDELNRLIKVNDALNHNITFTFDENGNKKTETDPNGNTITYTYDASNRLIKVKDTLNHETTYDYDSASNKLNETDANSKKTKYAYDALNRLVSITDANNNVTYYSYDATGHLLNITDANNHKTKQEYDSLDRLKKIIYPSGNQTEYTYDNIGNLIERKDAKGLSTYYEYDELNRLVQVKYPDSSTIVYEYNQEGNPTKVTNNAGFGETIYYTYGSLDRVISVRVDYGSFDKYVNYTYDEVGLRKTMTDPEGNVTYYTYDAINRLINITAPGHNPILFQYDKGGRRTKLDYPSGAYTTYSYDNANRITTIWHKKSGGATIAVYNYTYDNVGNILNFTENDVNYTTYTYDNTYRLINASYPDGSWTAYTYDGVGNRLTMKTNSGTTSYTYDEDNRILTAGSITYKHDKNGNLINRTNGSNITLYEYDYDNRLKKVTLPNSSTVTYQYAGNGDRLNKTSYIGTTLYLYDGDNILTELDQNGAKTAFYAYGPNIDEPIFMVRNGASFYYHTDHLGSIRVLTDANENVVATYQYDVFGSILQETGNVNNPYRFTSREWDVEAGLYYYRARYYNAVLGRFLQKDLERMIDGPNLYPYVRNNPLNRKDPFGTFSIKMNLCCALSVPVLRIKAHTDWDYFYDCIGVGSDFFWSFLMCLAEWCIAVCAIAGAVTLGTACLACIGICAGVELAKVVWCYAQSTKVNFYIGYDCVLWLPC